MGHKFAEIGFTQAVKEVQARLGSRKNYERMEGGEDFNHRLGVAETEFIQARDSFYMASVSESGWPYIQHRGGPKGFMKVLDEKTLGFADYNGNRQYISTGNFANNDKVSLFFMDYPNKTRLKLLGRIKLVDTADHELLTKLQDDDYRARVERAFVIQVEAFDWNCPKHITPRYSEGFGGGVESSIEDKAFIVDLVKSKLKLKVAADESVLDALLAADIDTPFSCQSGSCKQCAIPVIEGEPEHRDSVLTDIEKEQLQLFCPCVSRAKTPMLTLDL